MSRAFSFFTIAALFAALLVVLAFQPWEDEPTLNTTALEDVDGVTVPVALTARNDSRQWAFGTLAYAGPDETLVGVELRDPRGLSQPVHLHVGECGQDDRDVFASLPELEGAPGAQTVDVRGRVRLGLVELLERGLSLDIHESVTDDTIAACGDLPPADAVFGP